MWGQFDIHILLITLTFDFALLLHMVIGIPDLALLLDSIFATIFATNINVCNVFRETLKTLMFITL